MKEIIDPGREVVNMRCENTNCQCLFRTDEYKRFNNIFGEERHKDTCPICKQVVTMVEEPEE